MRKYNTISATFMALSLIMITGSLATYSCRSSRTAKTPAIPDTLITNWEEKGAGLVFYFEKGESFNHPLMALWVEDTAGNYLQTLYVAESIAKGIYGHGDKSTGKWLPGPIRRPATLPVWAHSRGVREDDGYYIPTVNTALPDAMTGATPPGDFVIMSHLSQNIPPVFDIYFEINQSWDWNEYWTNNKYPDDEDYKTSCQPALVYKARIGKSGYENPVELSLIGHSHYSGKDGDIYTDLSTITTAKDITRKAWVKLELNVQ
ncbi:MAG: hypothetical protein JXR41_06595 [Bacteroidales bacterium]|nr:hypothetical protein [Bacteroidales bacterium]MBN2762739.1 hypothetical protein [Bacteroidales bacterium]